MARTRAGPPSAIEPVQGAHDDGINGILIDLLARETATFSHVLSRSLVGTLSRTGALAREPERSASFVVLKQTHAPSVLVELGFLSNPTEEQLMTQTAWQQQMASSIAAAVDTYFARKQATTAHVPASVTTGGLPP